MHHLNRRSFLQRASLVAATSSLSPKLLRAQRLADDGDPPDLRTITDAALDAAKSAGASYVDVHYRDAREEFWGIFEGVRYPAPTLSSEAGLSVRSLVRGYWGMASTNGVATLADAVRLGRDAAAQATMAAKGKPRTVDLAQLPRIASGHWTMPVEIDPFSVTFEEKADFYAAMMDLFQRKRYRVQALGGITLRREDRTFASSEGAFATQRVYLSSALMGIGVDKDWQGETTGFRAADLLTPTGAGWEYIRSAEYRESADRLIDDAMRSRRPKPVDVGRYDVVFDAKATARLLSVTIGTGTELDRAMGYEANNGGTSYITDPAGMLGTYKIGSPLLTVTANRSLAGGAATVKWDEEGVEPVDTTIVTAGILTDMQTTREAASWLAPYYKAAGKPVRSNGCAGMETSTAAVTQVNPNFTMTPGKEDLSFDDLVKDTKKGYAVIGGYTDTDQQALNGTGHGFIVYEIVNGTLGAVVEGVEYVYRTPNLWQGLVAVGGPRSVVHCGVGRTRTKGANAHTVSAVPAKMNGVAIVDYLRKA